MADPMQRVRYWLGGLLPGAAARRVQVAEYAEEWRRRNEAALSVDGPLWIVLGDSSAQAVGATSIDRGYVGGVLDLLRAQRDSAWRVVNLSRTGARAHDVVADQLPEMEALGPAALVSCAVGGNDLLRGSLDDSRRAFATIAASIPRGALLATMPRGVREGRAVSLNEVVWSEAATHGHGVVDLWAHTGPPWEGKFSADQFHPNDTGYMNWVAAFAEALELREAGSAPPAP